MLRDPRSPLNPAERGFSFVVAFYFVVAFPSGSARSRLGAAGDWGRPPKSALPSNSPLQKTNTKSKTLQILNNFLLDNPKKIWYKNLEAIHQFFHKIATEYYGKKFMVTVPRQRFYLDSSIIDSAVTEVNAISPINIVPASAVRPEIKTTSDREVEKPNAFIVAILSL